MDSGAASDSGTGAEKYEKLTQRGPNIGPASATLAQHQADVSCFLRGLVSGSEILFETGQLTVYRGLEAPLSSESIYHPVDGSERSTFTGRLVAPGSYTARYAEKTQPTSPLET